MFDTTKVYLNALKEKKIADKITLYDASGNNLVPLSNDSYESLKLEKELINIVKKIYKYMLRIWPN